MYWHWILGLNLSSLYHSYLCFLLICTLTCLWHVSSILLWLWSYSNIFFSSTPSLWCPCFSFPSCVLISASMLVVCRQIKISYLIFWVLLSWFIDSSSPFTEGPVHLICFVVYTVTYSDIFVINNLWYTTICTWKAENDRTVTVQMEWWNTENGTAKQLNNTLVSWMSVILQKANESLQLCGATLWCKCVYYKMPYRWTGVHIAMI